MQLGHQPRPPARPPPYRARSGRTRSPHTLCPPRSPPAAAAAPAPPAGAAPAAAARAGSCRCGGRREVPGAVALWLPCCQGLRRHPGRDLDVFSIISCARGPQPRRQRRWRIPDPLAQDSVPLEFPGLLAAHTHRSIARGCLLSEEQEARAPPSHPVGCAQAPRYAPPSDEFLSLISEEGHNGGGR